jgi:hypothetical protein
MRVESGLRFFLQRISRIKRIFGFWGEGRSWTVRNLRRIAVGVGLLMVLGLVYSGTVEAHAGGKMQVASQDGGPFKFTVWTSPDPAVTGEIHVATAVASVEDALPVLNAEVFIELVPKDGVGQSYEGEAVTDNSANQFLYEVIFELPDEGLYEVTVTAIGSDFQFGSVSFDLEVVTAPPLGPGIAALVVLAIVTGVAVWFYLRSTSPKAEVVEADELDATGE